MWAGLAHAQLPADAGTFHTVLASDSLMVAARVVTVPDAPASRFVLAEARLAEPAAEGLRLMSEWLAVLDCQATPGRMAVLRELRNVQPAGQPVAWTVAAGGQALPVAADWGKLPFAPVAQAVQAAQRLQLPGVWQVVSHFACARADGGYPALARQVSRTGGLPDLATWRCPLTDRVGRHASDIELAFSPSASALRINDSWVADGLLDDRYLGFELDGLAFRYMRDSGVLRVVRRDEMQHVASAQCAPVAVGRQAATGW